MTAKEFEAGVVAIRRAQAMVATEAAMARETDPRRYAVLERRNTLAGGAKLDAAPSMLESLTDTFWIDDVDAGLWTPNADCSNCLDDYDRNLPRLRELARRLNESVE